MKLRVHRCWYRMILAIIVALCLIAQSGWCDSKVTVVASTSWTGAIARAAGADEVVILAPFELKHPAEYDYRPADLAKLQGASLVVYGGYEPFVKKLVTAAGYPETQVVKVRTTNVPDNLILQARLVAEKLGTQKKELKWEKKFEKVCKAIERRAQLKMVNQTRVLVQEHQAEMVKWLGYDIAGSFSATELSPAKVMELAKLKPDLIIDNIHNPQGKPILQVAQCRYVELISFPPVQAPTLIGLFEENARRLGL